MKVHLFIIDPQNDFCIADDGRGNRGALVVPGAEGDMARLTALVGRVGKRLDDISVTLDSHQGVGIERPRWWKRVGDGMEPAPFTILGIHPDGRRIVKHVPGPTGLAPTDEEYTTYLPSHLHQGGATGKGAFGYLEALAKAGRYPHVIWPVHCRVGSWGFGVVPSLDAALFRWEIEQFARVNYVAKGNNPDTEHFSGVRAEVPDPRDPGTQVNTRLIQALEEADVIALAGEALSHCVANTGRDIADCFADPRYIEKMVLLTDACSNVTGFDALGSAFVRDLTARGMKLSTTAEFLA